MELTDAIFEEVVIKSDKLVLVDFWAEWCGPCKMLSPTIDNIEAEYEGRIVVGKVNVDNNPETVTKFSIRSIPTIIFFKNGEIVDKQVGATLKTVLAKKIEALL